MIKWLNGRNVYAKIKIQGLELVLKLTDTDKPNKQLIFTDHTGCKYRARKSQCDFIIPISIDCNQKNVFQFMKKEEID